MAVDPSPTPSTSWAASRPTGIGLIVAGLVLLVALAVAGSDPVGIVLLGLCGLSLAGFGVCALLIRPRLAIGSVDGKPALLVRTLLRGRREIPVDQVRRVRVTRYPRLGRRTVHLDIDLTDDQILIYSRWDLGTAPMDVADELYRAGFPRG